MKARQIIVLGVVLTLLFCAGCETEIDEMTAKYIKLAETEFTVMELSTRALTAIVLPEFAADVSVNWTSDKPDTVTVIADETDSRQATFKARAIGTATITATTVAGGHSADAVITVTAAPQYSLKVRNAGTSLVDGTTQNSDNILTWKGESWDQSEDATVSGPDAGDSLTIVNNETGGTILNGTNTNNTMVYLTEPVKPPFTWRVTLNLSSGTGSSSNAASAQGVKVWVSRDADNEWTEATSNYKYRQAAIRWYSGGTLRTFFMDSADTPNIRNIESADVSFAAGRTVTLEIEHTGTQYVMRYPGVGGGSITTGSFGASNSSQAINPALVDPDVDGYFPGFSVAGATVTVTGVTLIR
jgi:hypothetical protein